jgi:preprotein translocase subunit SecE
MVCRSVAQLVERRSPKPKVVGSSPPTPATYIVFDTGGPAPEACVPGSREPQEHGQETGFEPVRDQEPRRQDGGGARATLVERPLAAPAAPKKRTNPVQFFREVRAEARKITWTTRKETWITSVMVFIMVVMAVAVLLGSSTGLGFAITCAPRVATAAG